ncbi:hypothetical protein EYZ11_011404 [Aspergillus tanneri]|uniref:Uncharacterized protein n=1 Tax=Aspergillus tanneri TaxID=1220188 RepID=A0A4S3J2X1_9EURO|nr:hypothetical protein EYZ11_011404 [Aspergillus tanneri]
MRTNSTTVRHTPQFWSFFMSAESRPYYFIDSNAKDLIPTTMVARISGYDNNHATGAMPIIHNDPTANVEYRSGGSYYIRTKSTPHLYWFLKDTNIYLDTRKATKFQIYRDDSERNRQSDDRRVLERKDLVQLSALNASGSQDVGVSNQIVTTAQSPFQFSFGCFYNGNFGVDWSSEGNDPYLVYRASYAGEEWELVN